MSQIITLTLEAVDIFQVLDALNDRAQSWEKTEAALNGEFDSEDFFVPEECNDASEAADIAQHFRDIVTNITTQLNASS